MLSVPVFAQLLNVFLPAHVFLRFDPLEQFEVRPVWSVNGTVAINGVALTLLIVLAVLFTQLLRYNINHNTTLDFITSSVYQLVRSIVRENLYIHKQQYFAILFYLFNVLLLANLIGLLPSSFTITSSFVVTLFLALTHFIGVNLIGRTQHQWKLNDLFLPSGAPLIIAPFLILIEAVSYVARVLSLSIRLFANRRSGHALLKILIGFSWIRLSSGSLLVILSLFPWVVVTAVIFLELLIAFLQSYVFTILVSLYLNDVLSFHE